MAVTKDLPYITKCCLYILNHRACELPESRDINNENSRIGLEALLLFENASFREKRLV